MPVVVAQGAAAELAPAARPPTTSTSATGRSSPPVTFNRALSADGTTPSPTAPSVPSPSTRRLVHPSSTAKARGRRAKIRTRNCGVRWLGREDGKREPPTVFPKRTEAQLGTSFVRGPNDDPPWRPHGDPR